MKTTLPPFSSLGRRDELITLKKVPSKRPIATPPKMYLHSLRGPEAVGGRPGVR